MKKDGDDSTETIHFYQNKYLIAAYILLTLTLISFRLVCGLYARYSSGGEEIDA
ncbi:MAG: hypothetical protein II919_05955 [Lachnospiraceae bacterium]|nr:hypothetical protein [Lachnospiraceae bacterium]